MRDLQQFTEVDELRALKHHFDALQMNQANQQPCVTAPELLNPPSNDWGPAPFWLEQTSAVPVENATSQKERVGEQVKACKGSNAGSI